MSERVPRSVQARGRSGKRDPRDDTGIPAPIGLRASTVELGCDQYLVLSFPLPTWPLPATLTAAERGVASALLGGLNRAEIAQLRGTSQRTIANQIASLFDKLGVQSQVELAVALARRCEPWRLRVDSLAVAADPPRST